MTPFPLIPTNDCVIVKRLEAEATTASGLHVPETARRERFQAEVVAVGPGRRVKNSTARIAPEVTVGDTVLVVSMAGRDFALDHKSYACVRESEIMAVVG